MESALEVSGYLLAASSPVSMVTGTHHAPLPPRPPWWHPLPGMPLGGRGVLLYSYWNVSFHDKSAGSWTWGAWACWVGKKRGKGFFPNPKLPLASWTPKWPPWGVCVCVCLVTQSCPTLCNPVDYSLSGSSVHGILQARVLEWVAMLSSRGSSQSGDRTQVSRIESKFCTIWATREAKPPKGCSTVAPPKADSCPGCGLSTAPSGRAHVVSLPSRLQPQLKSPPLGWQGKQQILGFCCVSGNSTNYYFAHFKNEETSTERWSYLFKEADQRKT